ncbi:MAG: alginate lyase family protein [Promethearchaeota archaeon]
MNFEKLRSAFFDTDIFKYSNTDEITILLEYLKKNSQDELDTYIEQANRLCYNKVPIFEKEYHFEKNFDWFYGFTDDFYWKFERSDKIEIRPKYKDEFIDIKLVWELNRHQFLQILGIAYLITKQEKYAIRFKEIILDWIKKNPPLYGVNWISGLEISLRLISWILSLYFFKGSININNKRFFAKIFKSMFQHAYFLRNFYTKRSFNHTIGDMCGAYLFSKIFNGNSKIIKWQKKFSQEIIKNIKLQIRPDGVNIEQSLNYHKFVLEFFSLFLIISPELIHEPEKALIAKMFEYLFYSIKPNHKFPLIGDSDEGRALFLSNKGHKGFLELLSLGSVLFRNKGIKYLTNHPAIITVFLLGIKGIEDFNKLESIESNVNFKFFENSGYFIIRNNWKKNGNYLFVDFGRFGPQNAPHSHSDITNIIFSYKGKDILIDSGTYSYNRSWEERSHFRSSVAHNIISINHNNQAKIEGWFSWANKPKLKRKVNKIESNFELCCIHNGYKGFLVKRVINTNKSVDEIIITDKIFYKNEAKDEEPHDVDLFFHFNNDIDLKMNQNTVQIDNNLLLTISSDNDFSMKINKTYFSPIYSQKCEIKVLNIHLNHNFKFKNSLQIISKIKSIE